MNRTGNQLVPPELAENDGRWDLVLRVAASRHFSKAPQLHEILVYICQRSLSDPSTSIREYEIGCNALGRRPDFNPNEDNIVRVQISHLRKKLDEYFATEGKDEPVQITVPRGAYLPRFEPRPEAAAAPEPAAGKTESPVQVPAVRRSIPWIMILSASTGLLLIACVYLALRALSPQTASPPAASQPARHDPFWSRFFGSGQPVGLVVADSCLVMLQDILHTDLSLADYLSHQYPDDLLRKVPDPALRSSLELIASRQYTSLADINIATRLVGLSIQHGGARAAIRYSRHVNIRDFKTDNLVLIGSRRSVPWVQLFEPQMNFSFEEDKAVHQFVLRNKKPRPGERASYMPTENGGTAETYAVIGLLPNLGNTGSVLILSGISMVASEAAGEFVARNDFSQELARVLGRQGSKEQYFELLLKTRVVAGTSKGSEIVAARVIQASAPGN